MRNRSADVCVAEQPLATHSDHWLPLRRSNRRHGQGTQAQEAPFRMLDAQQCPLAVWIQSREVGERSSGVAEAELPGWSGEHERRSGRIGAQTCERIACGNTGTSFSDLTG